MTLNKQVRLSSMMFLELFIWGTWFVTLGPYLSHLRFSGQDIGLIYSTTGWAALVTPFIVGMIADRFFPAQKMMAVLHFAGAGLLCWVSFIKEPGPFFWVLLAYTFCYMPTLSLANAIAFEQMEKPEKEFPPIRVLGTIGWIVAGLSIGYMPEIFRTINQIIIFIPESISGLKTIEDTNIPLLIGAGASLLMGFYSLTLPNTPPKLTGQAVKVADILGLKALALLKNKSFAIFILCSLLICIPLSFYFQSASIFLTEMKISNPVAKMTMGQGSEIFFMLVMPLFFSRLGVKYMLMAGMGAWAARYFLFNQQVEWMIYGGILLHGICYDFFFVTGQIYVDQKAPSNIRASAQGFIALVTLGLGMIIGNLINGVVTDYYSIREGEKVIGHNWQAIWMIPAVMGLVVMILFGILFKQEKPAAAPRQSA